MDQTSPDKTIPVSPDPLQSNAPDKPTAPPPVKEIIQQADTSPQSPSNKTRKQALAAVYLGLLVIFIIALYFTLSRANFVGF